MINLKKLSLYTNDIITDEGIKDLIQLESLIISYSNISDRGLKNLKNLKKLKIGENY